MLLGRKNSALLAVTTSTLVSASICVAQSPRVPDVQQRTPFAIAIVPELDYGGADAVVIRRPDQELHDVILVRASKASPALLTAGVRQLAAARSLDGDSPRTAQVIRVGLRLSQRNVREWGRRGEPSDWLSTALEAQPRELLGVGSRVRYVILFMPNQARGLR